MKRVTGSCVGCGQCCRVLALPIHGTEPIHQVGNVAFVPQDASKHSPGFTAFLAARGVPIHEGCAVVQLQPARAGLKDIWFAPYNGRTLAFLRHRCPHLTADNQCDIHGTDAYPSVCRDFPTVFDDLTGLPDCSYAIEDDGVGV